MSTAHVKTAQEIYAAFGRGDIPAIIEHLSPDVEWDYAYPDRGVPWLKPRRGRAEVAAFFQDLALLEFKKFEITAILGEGNLVIGVASVEVVVRATGKKVVEDPELHVWHFDDRGQVIRFRHAMDTQAHLEASRP